MLEGAWGEDKEASRGASQTLFPGTLSPRTLPWAGSELYLCL